MDYKRLGDYIREVNLRNRELKVTEPMGINIDKRFMPSVANVIGTDLSAYKMVCKNQFACNLMHVGRDEKIPIAMHTDDNPIIVSPAYFVFEIIPVETHGRASLHNDNELLPEYLMMWFRRAEFDRNAWFYTDADVRGGLDKKALMDMRLPVPTIARQREIVAEYETLGRRIHLNEQMIAKLEETAQALYRKMFVDGVDKENLPEGWRWGKLFDVSRVIYGFPFNSDLFCDDCSLLPVVRIRDIVENKTYTYTSEDVDDKYGIKDGEILIGMDGNFHMTIWSGGRAFQNQRIVRIIPNHEESISSYQIFFAIINPIKELETSIEGTTVAHLSDKDMKRMTVIVATQDIQEQVYSQFEAINRNVILYKKENLKLTELQSLLLARMGK
jgi:type I restriction enzyme S subunit